MQRAEAGGSLWFLGVVKSELLESYREALLYLLTIVTFISLDSCDVLTKHILTEVSSFAICPAIFFILYWTLREMLTGFHRDFIVRESASLTRAEK